MMEDLLAVGGGGATVPERHLDAVVDLGAGDLRGSGEHVDSREAQAVLLPGGRQQGG